MYRVTDNGDPSLGSDAIFFIFVPRHGGISFIIIVFLPDEHAIKQETRKQDMMSLIIIFFLQHNKTIPKKTLRPLPQWKEQIL